MQQADLIHLSPRALTTMQQELVLAHLSIGASRTPLALQILIDL